MWNPDIKLYESNADFGCRKILGMRNVTSYINAGKSSVGDKFVSSKKKNDKTSKLKKALAIAGTVLASSLILLTAIKKKKAPKTEDVQKIGIFKKLFSKKR